MKLVLLALLPILGGCTLSGALFPVGAGDAWSERARLTPVQECAIGYDMARKIYETVRVRDTLIRLSPGIGDCGEHAARYLRKAGFAVDETATRPEAPLFSVATWEDPEPDTVIVTTTVPGLRLTRAYRRAPTGVRPASGWGIMREDGQDAP